MAVKEMRAGREVPAATGGLRTLAPIDQAPDEDAREAPAGMKRYWLGTLDQCPLQNATIGGRTFHRRTDKGYHVEGERMPRKIERRGALEWLTDEQVAKIKDASRRKFVRRVGDSARVVQPRPGAPRYASDDPIGMYLYCIPVEDAMRLLGAGWHDAGSPPSLLSAGATAIA